MDLPVEYQVVGEVMAHQAYDVEPGCKPDWSQ
jgi:hypothetical protein